MANHLPVNVAGNARDKFRDEFATFDTENNWELVSTGSGMAISIAGTTTKYLNINTGINVNSETIIRSRPSFKLPNRFAFGVSLSQRIANQEVYVELVGCSDKALLKMAALRYFRTVIVITLVCALTARWRLLRL